MGKPYLNKSTSSSSYNRIKRKNHTLEKPPEKLKITADRLTLLPKFLSTKVTTRDKSTHHEKNSSSPSEAPKLRRSWRLCMKNQPVTVSGYFNQLVEDRNEQIDDLFEKDLFKNLNNFHLRDTDFYRKEIQREIHKTNQFLIGKEMAMNRKRTCTDEEKENCPIKFPYIPQSKWVFHTPPNRKLNFRNVNQIDENSMQPAVIERRNDRKIVYELNKNFNVDLSNYNSKDEITIDKRFMIEVTNQIEEEKMDYTNDENYELENYFLSLTCRPKKKNKKLPRIANLRRTNNKFDPEASCSNVQTEMNTNENLNDLEETFTFKFTSDETSEGVKTTTGHLFDCEGNKKNTFNFRF